MYKRLFALVIGVLLSACSSGKSQQVAAPQTTASVSESAGVEERILEQAALKRAEAARIEDSRRHNDVKAIATALTLYSIDKNSLPPARDDELKGGAFGVVGKYLNPPFTYGDPSEAYCYGYSGDRSHGFIAAWLAVEDRPIVELASVGNTADSGIARQLEEGGRFMQGVDCPAVSGFTVVRF